MKSLLHNHLIDLVKYELSRGNDSITLFLSTGKGYNLSVRVSRGTLAPIEVGDNFRPTCVYVHRDVIQTDEFLIDSLTQLLAQFEYGWNNNRDYPVYFAFPDGFQQELVVPGQPYSFITVHACPIRRTESSVRMTSIRR